jgi:hypothetical protein
MAHWAISMDAPSMPIIWAHESLARDIIGMPNSQVGGNDRTTWDSKMRVVKQRHRPKLVTDPESRIKEYGFERTPLGLFENVLKPQKVV